MSPHWAETFALYIHLSRNTYETNGCNVWEGLHCLNLVWRHLTHTHTPPVSCRPAGLVADCCGLLLFGDCSRGFGRHRGKFLAVLQTVSECFWLTAALTRQAENQRHVDINSWSHYVLLFLLDWSHEISVSPGWYLRHNSTETHKYTGNSWSSSKWMWKGRKVADHTKTEPCDSCHR